MIYNILIAVAVVSGIGLVCGIVLALASHFMAVKVDEKWWRNDISYLQKIWTRYFKILGKPDQAIVKYGDAM